MATQNWISLFEYSNKNGVSLSTLRRRIKNHAIPFKLEQGKYFLLDDAGQNPEQMPLIQTAPQSQPQQSLQQQAPGYVEASVLSSANRLVEELKAAYAKILQEKEEQIGILKEEIVDLKMLVSLLEKQNSPNKMELERNSPQPQSSTSSSSSMDTFFFPEIGQEIDN